MINTLLSLIDIRRTGKGPALEFTPSYKTFYLTLLLYIPFFLCFSQILFNRAKKGM